MHKGWPERWWTMALVALALTGFVAYDIWWAAGILAEPVVDWWGLLGPCLGGTWLALLAVSAVDRSIALRKKTRAVPGETQAGP
ncbi:hypothetical protein ACFU8I_35375 [Streptomyces sp. NPDC057540]|uniref:hypothetical protein n=1 Tax=Streptomyces sp. NPDC057540 TaxID=3346160 RepID=UPI0036983783